MRKLTLPFRTLKETLTAVSETGEEDEREGERGDKALGKLVRDENKEMATFYAARSEVEMILLC
jgi:hypothetical protein